MLLAEVEFFTYENEVWYRSDNGSVCRLTESDTDFNRELAEGIAAFYPKAYAALCEEYRACAANQSYFRFRIVSRFIRCNFAPLDNVPDVTHNFQCAFEFVSCPLRGECRYDRVICRPEFDHRLSPAEMRVMQLWYEDKSEKEIGDLLCVSPYTVHNHIRNAYSRIGVHSRSEFVRYATQKNLFP